MTSESLLITYDNVRNALASLIHTASVPKHNPLILLQLIDRHMEEGDFGFFSNPRSFALNEILVTIIREQYLQYRRMYDLPDIGFEFSHQRIKKLIYEDLTTRNTELISWSWFFFHYVEPSTNITQDEFAQWANVDNRTIRRYQHSIIERLVIILIKKEQTVRQLRAKQQLYLCLPHKGRNQSLLGRDKELSLLRSDSFPHTHVSGPPGVGKSSLIESFLKLQIDDDKIDCIVWIDNPPSLEYVNNILYEQLIYPRENLGITEFLMLKRVTIVFDHADVFIESTAEIRKLWEKISNAQIYLVTNLLHYTLPNFKLLIIEELDRNTTKELLAKFSSVNEASGDMYATEAWEYVGGNPLASLLYYRYRLIYDTKWAGIHTLNHLFDVFYEALSPYLRCLWFLFSLGSRVLTLDLIRNHLTAFINIDDCINLLNRHLVKLQGDTLSVSAASRNFIHNQFVVDISLQKHFEAFLKQSIEEYKSGNIHWQLILEAVLTTDWPNSSLRIRHEIVLVLWREGLHQGRYALWYTILEDYATRPSENIELTLGFSKCLRCLGQLQEAASILGEVVKQSGLKGRFDLQNEALLDWCVVLRHQGLYGKAVQILDRLKRTMKSEEFAERIIIEDLEIAIDTRNWKFIEGRMPSAFETHPRLKLLRIEALIQDDKTLHNELLRSSLDSIHALSENDLLIPHTHVVLGRLYERLINIKQAQRHFSAAVTLLEERDNDPLALARAQSNLAAILLRQDRIEDARVLLQAAEHTQRIIKDSVGLATTLHNKVVLLQKIVN